jgi:hypothetical protein
VLKAGGNAGDPDHATGDEALVLLAIQEDKPVGVIDVVGVRLVGLPIDTWRATFGHLLVIDPEVFPQLAKVLLDPVRSGQLEPVICAKAAMRGGVSRPGSTLISANTTWLAKPS